jgi:DNA primase
MISQDDIQRINDASRIEEVVGDFVNLKKRGANLIGLCPFHNEKTPSFTVSPTKNIYKCFGCGAAGGSVNFVMQHEQFTYPEALRYLAKKYNIELIEKEVSPEEKQSEDEKQLMYILHEMSQKYYADYMYNTDEGKSIGLSYFMNRKFSDAAITKFGLGYAPEGHGGFAAYAVSKGYKLESLIKAGLAVEASHPLDRFRGRVVFPIQSISGRVIGFGARIMRSDAKTAKYLNSPETPVYQKSKVLYGLNLAKNSIVKNDNCYIVEGYTDVISLHQAGIDNVVSSSGTSLTEDQIRLIKRYTPNVTVVFDGDPAGVKASFRGIDMLLDAGMNVKVLMLPENEDPDSFATANRDSDISVYFSENAESFISYKTRFLTKEAGNDPIKKAAIIKDIVQSIARIQDGISRALFVRECSEIIQIHEQILTTEISKILRQKYASGQQQDTSVRTDLSQHVSHPVQMIETVNKYQNLETRLSGLLLNYCNNQIPVFTVNEEGKTISAEVNVSDFIVRSLIRDNFLLQDPYAAKVFDFFRQHYLDGTDADAEMWVTAQDDSLFRGFLIDLLTSPYELSTNWFKELNVQVLSIDNAPSLLAKDVKSTVSYYKLNRLQDELISIEEKLSDTNDIDEQNALLEHRQVIQSVMKDIAGKLGTTRID